MTRPLVVTYWFSPRSHPTLLEFIQRGKIGPGDADRYINDVHFDSNCTTKTQRLHIA